jgi:hypothetical protein
MAPPVNALTLTVRKGTYRWTAPCGADLPDESVSKLVEIVEGMLP